MKDKEYHSITKMIEYIDKCKKYIGDYIFEQFVMDEKTVDAVILNVSQIGELVKNISRESKEKYSSVEWRVLKDVRNRIVHDYEGIKYYLIWDICKNDLPQLKSNLKEILKKENR